MNNPDIPTTDHPAPEAGDPRVAFAHVTALVRPLMEHAATTDLSAATPCAEFSVKDLLEHFVCVMRRVAAMGEGNDWSAIGHEAVDSGWSDQFIAAAGATHKAWTDPAKLGQMHSVPWGQVPDAALIGSYTGELAVHAWDLAQATGQNLTIDDDLLAPVLAGAQMGIPAAIRQDPEVPFGPVVESAPGASVLLQLVNWMGHDTPAA